MHWRFFLPRRIVMSRRWSLEHGALAVREARLCGVAGASLIAGASMRRTRWTQPYSSGRGWESAEWRR